MSKPKHTPGPWKIVSSRNVEPGPYFPIRVSGPYADLARVTSEADARLMVQAPRMFELCVDTLAVLTMPSHGLGTQREDLIAELKKVIAAAGGVE
jgi:hypothetical protein